MKKSLLIGCLLLVFHLGFSQNRLCCDQLLAVSTRFESPNHQYFLVFQTDGNLVVYRQNGTPLWASNTGGITATKCIMQADGNLVIYNGSKVNWSSNTHGNPNASLVMQDDGNLVIKKAEGTVIWMTKTGQPPLKGRQ